MTHSDTNASISRPPMGESFLDGGGELGARIRAYDWERTPLGPPAEWPQSLKTAVRIMLTSRQPFWLAWGPELTYLYNDPYKAIVGGKHPAALGRPIAEVWSELWDGIGPMIETVMRNNEGTYVEAQLLIMERYGYPEETYYTYSFSPVPDDEGGPGGLLCANTDDTRRVIGERQLATLRDLAATAASAKSWQDACALAGEALRENPRDLPFFLLYAAGEADAPLTLHGASAGTEALADPGRWPGEQVLRRQEPEVLSLSELNLALPTGAWPQPPRQAAALPVTPAGQAGAKGVLVVGLSPYRKFDQDYSSFLELISLQIGNAIANAQAFEAEKRRAEALAELNRAKTVFFSNVSHELRTPLTLMLGPLEDTLQHAQALSDEDRARLEVAHRNSVRLLKLVNTLLDFARIEAGRAHAEFEATDLSVLSADLASNFRSACERAGLVLTVHCPPVAEPAYVDREMWEKIVLNLVSNAFKFTFEGEICVSVRAGERHFELEVRDTGVGIPASALPRMFERFYRVDGAPGRSHEGSGIGLALVQELVKLHGGSLDVQSIEGVGSTFTVSIPKGHVHLPPEHVKAGEFERRTTRRADPYVSEALSWLAQPETASTRTLPKDARRVLLADDNADLREYAQRVLAEEYEVEAVADGQEALIAARRRPPDLIVSDVMMPRLDGFGLVGALREDPQLRTIPVLMLSARAGEEARLEGIGRGADDYLSKPFSARELLVRVGALLQSADMRRKATDQLVQSEQRLQIALETGNLGAWEFNLASGALTSTARCAADFGLAPHAARTCEDLLDQVHPEDRAHADAVFRGAVADHGDADVEHRVHWPDGSTHWLVLRGRPVRDADGVPQRVIGFSLDVTQRRQTENAIRLSEARYRLLTEVSPQTVWMARSDGYVTYANQHWYDFSGLTPEQTEGQGWTQAIHPDHRQRIKAAWTEAAAHGQPWYVEIPFRRARDGEYRWHLSHGQPLYDDQSAINGWMGIAVDIHDSKTAEQQERRAAEEALAAAEANAKFRAFFEQGSYFAGVMKLDGTVVEANRLSLSACGFTRDEVIGRKFWNCGWWNRSEQLMAMIRAATAQAASGKYFRCESNYFLADGTQRMVDLILAPVTDDAGRVLFIAPTGTDITDRKRVEEELRQLATELSESDRRKDEFLATLSHELRNPLAPLRNCLDLMKMSQERTGDNALQLIHGMMQRQVEHLVRLVDDLLEMSRISRGVLELRKEPVEVETIVRNAIETAEPLIRAAGHELSVSLPPQPVWLNGDPVRLTQVLANLLNNAAKYTDAGGKIRLCAQQQADSVAIRVQDDGCGISPDVLPRMFEMFTRGDRAEGRYEGGLGIGLALSRRLTEMHDGALEAESEGLGTGSTFTVRLPVHADQRHGSSAEGRAPPALEKARILIVDDDYDAADSLRMLLTALGAEVRVVCDGPEALAEYTQFEPRFVLLDIGISGMDGFEVARRMRAVHLARRPVIVALAGLGQDQDRARGAGIDHHFVKPVDLKVLQKLLASPD